ncbi:hypothetical protein V6N13_038666 [Hibiscus sabdariffa]
MALGTDPLRRFSPDLCSRSDYVLVACSAFVSLATHYVVVFGDAMSNRILSQDQSHVCCARLWSHGVGLRGVRLARSLASLHGLSVALHCRLGVSTALACTTLLLGHLSRPASLCYKASISPRAGAHHVTNDSPMAPAQDCSPVSDVVTPHPSPPATAPVTSSVPLAHSSPLASASLKPASVDPEHVRRFDVLPK